MKCLAWKRLPSLSSVSRQREAITVLPAAMTTTYVRLIMISTIIYLFKVNNRNTRKRFEICLKLTIKTPERRQWLRSVVFYCELWTYNIFHTFSRVSIVDFEQVNLSWDYLIVSAVGRSYKRSAKSIETWWKEIELEFSWYTRLHYKMRTSKNYYLIEWQVCWLHSSFWLLFFLHLF